MTGRRGQPSGARPKESGPRGLYIRLTPKERAWLIERRRQSDQSMAEILREGLRLLMGSDR